MKKYLIILFFNILISQHLVAQTAHIDVRIYLNSNVNTSWNSDTLCPNSFALNMENVSVNKGTNLIYSWKHVRTGKTYSNKSIIIPQLTSPSITDTGQYIGTITDIDYPGEIHSDTIWVKFSQSPILFNTQESKCQGYNSYIKVTNQNQFATYTWYNITKSPTNIISTDSVLIVNDSNSEPNKSNEFNVITTDLISGCTSSASSIVAVNNATLKIEYGPKKTRCINQNNSITLTNSLWNEGNNMAGEPIVLPGYAYYKNTTAPGNIIEDRTTSGNNNFNLTLESNPIEPLKKLPTTTTNYIVKLKTIVGCEAYDTITVIVLNPPNVVAAKDTFICYDEEATLYANVTDGVEPYNYIWNGGISGNYSKVKPLIPTVYTVQVSDNSGCGFNVSSTMTVDVNDPIILTTNFSDSLFCSFPTPNVEFKAIASGGFGTLTYAWGPNKFLSDTTISNPICSADTAILYTITVKDANECTTEKTININTYIPPVAEMDTVALANESIIASFNAGIPENDGFGFEWVNIETGEVVGSASQISFNYLGDDTIKYEVRVIHPTNGCIGLDTVTVHYASENTVLWIPNIFSPNANKDENKKLYLFGDNVSPNDFKMIIFNQWGNVVFETTELKDIKDGWTGEGNPSGVYTYIISGKFKNGEDVQINPNFKGTFSLVK